MNGMVALGMVVLVSVGVFHGIFLKHVLTSFNTQYTAYVISESLSNEHSAEN
jgi:hypothetical protein